VSGQEGSGEKVSSKDGWGINSADVKSHPKNFFVSARTKGEDMNVRKSEITRSPGGLGARITSGRGSNCRSAPTKEGGRKVGGGDCWAGRGRGEEFFGF